MLNIALLNECTFPVGALTVGILLELDKFQVVEKLDNHLMVQWLFKIGSLSALPQEDTVVKLVGKVKGDFHKINKCKARKAAEIDIYLRGAVLLEHDSAEFDGKHRQGSQNTLLI